jgi:hypothetical protein
LEKFMRILHLRRFLLGTTSHAALDLSHMGGIDPRRARIFRSMSSGKA